jgi:hypothetical protein
VVLQLRKSKSFYSRSSAGLAVPPRVAYRGGIDPHTRDELQATLAARRELGPEHDDALVAGFLERIEDEIDRRVDERVRRAMPAPRRQRHGSVVNPANLALSIPIVAVAGGIGGVAGLLLAFAALVTVFLVSELR